MRVAMAVLLLTGCFQSRGEFDGGLAADGGDAGHPWCQTANHIDWLETPGIAVAPDYGDMNLFLWPLDGGRILVAHNTVESVIVDSTLTTVERHTYVSQPPDDNHYGGSVWLDVISSPQPGFLWAAFYAANFPSGGFDGGALFWYPMGDDGLLQQGRVVVVQPAGEHAGAMPLFGGVITSTAAWTFFGHHRPTPSSAAWYHAVTPFSGDAGVAQLHAEPLAVDSVLARPGGYILSGSDPATAEEHLLFIDSQFQTISSQPLPSLPHAHAPCRLLERGASFEVLCGADSAVLHFDADGGVLHSWSGANSFNVHQRTALIFMKGPQPGPSRYRDARLVNLDTGAESQRVFQASDFFVPNVRTTGDGGVVVGWFKAASEDGGPSGTFSVARVCWP